MTRMEFTIFYILFLVCAYIYEYKGESAIKSRYCPQGRIVAKWSYYIMAGSYIFILLSTPVEYLIVKRDINLIITSSGLIMYTSGLLLRRWAVNTLSEFWSLHIEIKENHNLIKNGPYKYVRHPNYLATILKGIGFSLIPNSFYILFYVLCIYIPVRIIRIYLEEKELIKQFGQEYINYKREVPALFPFKNFGGR
ncbi:MAG: isoprenylcysteine carboxylmethyltransferase family protein [Nitrospirota bacterium]